MSALQLRDAARRRLAFDVELGPQRGQTRRRETLRFEPAEHARQQPEIVGRLVRLVENGGGPRRKRQTTAPQTTNERQDIDVEGRQRVRAEREHADRTPRARRSGRPRRALLPRKAARSTPGIADD